MPIFEYICKDCKKRFETIVYGAQQPRCPLCRGTNLDKQISVFAVGNNRQKTSACSPGTCGTGACPMVD